MESIIYGKRNNYIDRLYKSNKNKNNIKKVEKNRKREYNRR